jgi:ubiquinone/menaquinone biosynthesis C-methylase UbiE
MNHISTSDVKDYLSQNSTEICYEDLARKEARYWGSVQPDPKNPQIWEDDRLFEIFFGKEYRHLIDRVVASGPRVMELGCGEGNLAIELSRRGLFVDAIDLSAERIERAKAKADAQKLQSPPAFIVADLNVISLHRNTFDCIVAHDSLHHILKLDNLLKEVHKALKPNGVVLVMDYVGMGRVRRLCAAFLAGMLPTYQPYSEKLKLIKRLKAFMATEDQKRKALANGTADALHQDSPFEEISQRSIVTLIRNRFCVVSEFSFNPFWYYLAPKVRLPQVLRYRVARGWRALDDLVVHMRLADGAFVFVEAKKS